MKAYGQHGNLIERGGKLCIVSSRGERNDCHVDAWLDWPNARRSTRCDWLLLAVPI